MSDQSKQSVAPGGRAVVFAAVCVALAAAAHGLMERRGVPVWAYLVGLAVVFGVSRAATTRECGLPVIVALMGGAQAGLHVLFTAAQQSVGGRVTGGVSVGGGMPGMAHGQPMGMTVASGMGHLSGGMVFGHAAAALVLAWWLRRGEAVVFALARALGLKVVAAWAWLLGLSNPLMPMPVYRVHGVVPDSARGARQEIRFALVRRGPPRVGLLV